MTLILLVQNVAIHLEIHFCPETTSIILYIQEYRKESLIFPIGPWLSPEITHLGGGCEAKSSKEVGIFFSRPTNPTIRLDHLRIW